MAFLLSVVQLWRKIFSGSSSSADVSADTDGQRLVDKKGKKRGNGRGCRVEKARRKAEERRQARLEKELFEEEERKQIEEFARLVEELRKALDEKMEGEREYGTEPPCVAKKDIKKEDERKRRERKKERDRESSKSNSDVEELEKKSSEVSECNKMSENDRREHHRNTPESMKTHSTDVRKRFKSIAATNHNRGNAGTGYFDRVKGTLFSSSRAFSGVGFLETIQPLLPLQKSTSLVNLSIRPKVLHKRKKRCRQTRYLAHQM